MSAPNISVAMPSYNAGRYIDEAIASALLQMGPDDELLVQDAASTDGSIERVQQMYGHFPQLKIVSEPDEGQADALNRGLARAANPIFAWLNADDRMFPGALDAVRAVWSESPAVDFVCGRWTLISPEGDVVRVCQPGSLSIRSLSRQPHVFSGAMYMRTSFMRECGGFDRNFHFCMDYDLVLRLASHNWRTREIPDTLGEFRWHTDSKTGAVDFGVVREALVVRRRYATGAAAHAEAWLASAVHAVAVAALPLRRMDWYTRLRLRSAKPTGG